MLEICNYSSQNLLYVFFGVVVGDQNQLLVSRRQCEIDHWRDALKYNSLAGPVRQRGCFVKGCIHLRLFLERRTTSNINLYILKYKPDRFQNAAISQPSPAENHHLLQPRCLRLHNRTATGHSYPTSEISLPLPFQNADFSFTLVQFLSQSKAPWTPSTSPTSKKNTRTPPPSPSHLASQSSGMAQDTHLTQNRQPNTKK